MEDLRSNKLDVMTEGLVTEVAKRIAGMRPDVHIAAEDALD